MAYWAGWGSLGVIFLQWLSLPRFQMGDIQVSLGPPERYAPGSVTALEAYGAWLIRDKEGFYALQAVCTHLGCAPRWQAPHFVCPCHGSRFHSSGQVEQGPATRSLERLHLQWESGQIVLRPQIRYRQENGGWLQAGAQLKWPIH